MEPWVTHALLLSGTFACATVVSTYRGFATLQGWAVGRWAYAEGDSWINIYACLSLIGAPLIGLIIGPWWLVVVVPVAGHCAAFLATNLLRSHIQPILYEVV